MEVTRRNYLTAAGGALLAASALAVPAEADEGKKEGDSLYGHGMVWNRNLPGVAGDLKLGFDLRADLESGTGLGTAEDPIHPDWNLHFALHSIEKEKRPKGEVRFTMLGEVIGANNPANVGLPLDIIAETVGDTTAVAIRLGDQAFAGAGVVVLIGVSEFARAILRILQGF